MLQVLCINQWQNYITSLILGLEFNPFFVYNYITVFLLLHTRVKKTDILIADSNIALDIYHDCKIPCVEFLFYYNEKAYHLPYDLAQLFQETLYSTSIVLGLLTLIKRNQYLKGHSSSLLARSWHPVLNQIQVASPYQHGIFPR